MPYTKKPRPYKKEYEQQKSVVSTAIVWRDNELDVLWTRKV